VISYPRIDAADGIPDTGDTGREVAVLITAANPITWRMGKRGTSLSLCPADIDAVLSVSVADQTEFAREAYAETNEGHIWDNLTPQGWARLYYPLKWLMHFAPDARPTMELASRVGWRKEPLPYTPPQRDDDVPEWAFWQMQALDACWYVVHWIIDNRQVETGEFGGVWGDDTDMTEYWTDYALACDDDGKIGDALRRFWRGVYDESLVDGVSRTIRDNLHSYEEGMGAICHQLLLDYGEPTALAHVMRAASHYDPKWMKQNADGTYSFRSNYFGYGGVYTEGKFGEDKGVNYLMLYPAAYLSWYNRHPGATKYIQQWKRGSEAPGLVGDAWLRLSIGDAEKRRAKYLERVAACDPRRRPMVMNALIDETGMDPEWQDRMVNGAAANQWKFFSGKLPKYAGYSPRMTEYFWLAYRASGDLKYLVQSYKQAAMFVNNQRWLYTVAQPSTDRIPLPRTSVVRARLGALSVNRGAGGVFWPRHALSYVRGASQVAALVTDNTDRTLQARFYCLARREHKLVVRLWRLQPGTYQASLVSDPNNVGAGGKTLWKRDNLEVDRGTSLELLLPPRAGTILRLQATKTAPQSYGLPDPAVTLDDVFLEYGDHLHFNVHNVGVKPVENLRIVVRDGHTGTTVGERVVKHIDAPLDMVSRTELVEVQNVNAITRGSIIIELDPDREHPDLNRHNNRIVFRY